MGNWQTVAHVQDNYSSLVHQQLNVKTLAIRMLIHETWGNDQVKIFENTSHIREQVHEKLPHLSHRIDCKSQGTVKNISNYKLQTILP